MKFPRSYLFVPGDRPERFAKALASGSDAVVLDLEDAVAPAGKPGARAGVASMLARTADLERIVVRINDASTPWFEDDLAMLREARAPAVMLPKAERPDTVAGAALGPPRARGLLPLVETVARACSAAEDPGRRARRAAPGVRHPRLSGRCRHGPAGAD
jgi:citrate lyase subunit beta/citryl-CoA lyase